MIERLAHIHDRLSACRNALDTAAAYGQVLHQHQIAGAGQVVINGVTDELAAAVMRARALVRFWTLQNGALKMSFPTNGLHRRVVDIAGLLVGAIPNVQPKDDALVYALGPAQWQMVTQQYAAALTAQHWVLPSQIALDGEFSAIRSNLIATAFTDAHQLKQIAINDALTALAAPGNVPLMDQAKTAKLKFYRKLDEVICASQTPQELSQVEQLVTQGYVPLDQIDA